MFFKREEKRKNKEKAEKVLGSGKVEKYDDISCDINYKLKELIAPDGLNDKYNSALLINDGGVTVYVRTFYISELPRVATFGVSFQGILNFPDSYASVFVDPLKDGRATKSLDKDIIAIESERDTALKDGDSNKARKLTQKLSEAQGWANSVDASETSLYEVAMIVTVHAQSMDELDKKTGDLYTRAQDKKIGLVNCYGYQKEAFLANQPTNQIYNYVAKSVNIGMKPAGFRWHRMNQSALAAIFNHLTSEFYHELGVYLGYNLSDFSPLVHNLIDPSHKGYGVVVAGTTGSGKSVLLKLLCSRWIPHGFRFICIDSDSKTSRGEYALTAEKHGGVHYMISPDSKHILNIFEINSELEFDETTGREFETLNVSIKVSSCVDTLLTIINRGSNENIFSDNILFIESILSESIKELYEERGIRHSHVASLFKEEAGQTVVDGKISSGKVKKEMPTLTDLYVKILIKRFAVNNDEYVRAFESVLASIRDYIRELNVCTTCAKVYDLATFNDLEFIHEQLKNVKKCSCGGSVERIVGSKPYFDGQSTIVVDLQTPIIDIDISQLHNNEKVIAQAIAGDFVKQNFINKNSVIPGSASPLCVIFDEMHRMLAYERTRKLIIDIYRVSRKHFVIPITGTQSIVDYTLYDDESLSIIRNATTQFIFSHKVLDAAALSKTTVLSPSQINATSSLSIGECFVIDEGTVVHAKIDYMKKVEAAFAETDSANAFKGEEGEVSEEVAI